MNRTRPARGGLYRALVVASALVGACVTTIATAGCDVLAPPPAEVLPEACPPDVALFDQVAFEPVLSRRCVMCHSVGGMAEGTRLMLDGDRATAMAATIELARETIDGVPLLVAKPTARADHGGGTIFDVGSPEESALFAWSEWARGSVDDCNPADFDRCGETTLGPRLLRRLTPAELDATVHDLLATQQNPGEAMPTDPLVGLFSNQAARTVGTALADQLRLAAEGLAAEVVAERLATIAPCAATAGVDALADRACSVELIAGFGARAFRRPLLTDEHARYLALYDEVSAEDGFAEGVRWVLTAMLQSPSFLYRAELGARSSDGSFAMTTWETATLMSYTMWGTTPDAELLAKAADGSLHTDEGFEAQLARLAADDRSVQSLRLFLDEWLALDRIDTVAHDAATYPEWSPALAAEMKTEWGLFVTDAAREGRTLADALTSTQTRLSPTLAAFYGLPAPSGAGFGVADLEGTGRIGLLSLGAFLATHSKPATSGPVQRGVAVRERLLCQELPPPPPNIDASPPPIDPEATTREQYSAHSALVECRSCHQLIDGIGFGFERFDGIGRARSEENGLAVDDSGEILGSAFTNGTFTGVAGLSAKLAESDEVSRCLAESFTTSVFGDAPAQLGCAVADEVSALDALRTPLAGLPALALRLAHARTRAGGADELDGPAADPTLGVPVDPDAPPVDPVDPDPLPDGVSVTLAEVNRWDTGACFDGIITNGTDADAGWSADLDVEGAITTVWNANAEELPSGLVRFTPAEAYNQTIAAGTTATYFGLCVAF